MSDHNDADLTLTELLRQAGIDLGPLGSMLEDCNRQTVDLPDTFDEQVSALTANAIATCTTARGPLPQDQEISDALATLVRGSSRLAGGGASGYLVVMSALLRMMRGDYRHADKLVIDELFLKPSLKEEGLRDRSA